MKEADIYVTATVASSFRIKYLDFTIPWLDSPLSFLIPYPTSSENIAAIVKPFDYKVIYLSTLSINKYNNFF